jgi:hypothetical protein
LSFFDIEHLDTQLELTSNDGTCICSEDTLQDSFESFLSSAAFLSCFSFS